MTSLGFDGGLIDVNKRHVIVDRIAGRCQTLDAHGQIVEF
jgi:hypothetical protein